MDLDGMILFAEKFSNLGWSVQAQLRDMLNGADPEELNPNAVQMIFEFLDNYAPDEPEVRNQIEDLKETYGGSVI